MWGVERGTLGHLWVGRRGALHVTADHAQPPNTTRTIAHRSTARRLLREKRREAALTRLWEKRYIGPPLYFLECFESTCCEWLQLFTNDARDFLVWVAYNSAGILGQAASILGAPLPAASLTLSSQKCMRKMQRAMQSQQRAAHAASVHTLLSLLLGLRPTATVLLLPPAKRPPPEPPPPEPPPELQPSQSDDLARLLVGRRQLLEQLLSGIQVDAAFIIQQAWLHRRRARSREHVDEPCNSEPEKPLTRRRARRHHEKVARRKGKLPQCGGGKHTSTGAGGARANSGGARANSGGARANSGGARANSGRLKKYKTERGEPTPTRTQRAYTVTFEHNDKDEVAEFRFPLTPEERAGQSMSPTTHSKLLQKTRDVVKLRKAALQNRSQTDRQTRSQTSPQQPDTTTSGKKREDGPGGQHVIRVRKLTHPGETEEERIARVRALFGTRSERERSSRAKDLRDRARATGLELQKLGLGSRPWPPPPTAPWPPYPRTAWRNNMTMRERAAKVDDYFVNLDTLVDRLHRCPNCNECSVRNQRGRDQPNAFCVFCNGNAAQRCESNGLLLDLDPQAPARAMPDDCPMSAEQLRTARVEWRALLAKEGRLTPLEECLLAPVQCHVKVLTMPIDAQLGFHGSVRCDPCGGCLLLRCGLGRALGIGYAGMAV